MLSKDYNEVNMKIVKELFRSNDLVFTDTITGVSDILMIQSKANTKVNCYTTNLNEVVETGYSIMAFVMVESESIVRFQKWKSMIVDGNHEKFRILDEQIGSFIHKNSVIDISEWVEVDKKSNETGYHKNDKTYKITVFDKNDKSEGYIFTHTI